MSEVALVCGGRTYGRRVFLCVACVILKLVFVVLASAVMQREGVSFLLCRKSGGVTLAVSMRWAVHVWLFSEHLSGCMPEGMKHTHSG